MATSPDDLRLLRASYILLEDFRLTVRGYDLRYKRVVRLQRRIARRLTAAGKPVPRLSRRET